MGLRNEYVSTMIYEELANGIIECVGGTENIASAINCMTRVRIRVNRDAAVRDDDLRALDGVLSVTHISRVIWRSLSAPARAENV